MENYNITPDNIYALIIGSVVALIIIWIITLIINTRKSKLNKKEKPIKEFKPNNSKYIMDFLDDLIKDKYEYYLYKEILPVYLGNESNKKEKFNKEKFLQLKNFFFLDILKSLSKNVKIELMNLFTKDGIELYIHQKFATLFNKTDAKFLNLEDNVKDNMFFMSEKINTKGK